MYIHVPESGTFQQTTKGHSSLRQRHYPAPFHRRPLDDMYLHEPFRTRPSSYPIDTSHIESMGMRDVNRELILSSSALEDNFDLASKSRNRDREVLSAATRAIVDTELHTSPRSAVAARRAQRGPAKPVVYSPPSNVQRKEVVLVRARAKPVSKRNPPPASAPRPRVPVKAPHTVVSPVAVGGDTLKRRAPLYLLANLRNLEMMLLSKAKAKTAASPPRYVPYVPYEKKRRFRKAALVGSRVDVITPDRKRPKSKYAQAKLRQIQMDKRSASPIIAESTSGLRASKPSFM